MTLIVYDKNVSALIEYYQVSSLNFTGILVKLKS